MTVNRKWKGAGMGAAAVLVTVTAIAALTAGDVVATDITVYKSPTCGCCSQWIAHLESSGFRVEAINLTDLSAVKREHGIRPAFTSCHTAVVDGYVIEGHVPARDIQRLLTDRPDVAGLAVPGMPVGSPGMDGPNPQPYNVLTFDAEGNTSVYARH